MLSFLLVRSGSRSHCPNALEVLPFWAVLITIALVGIVQGGEVELGGPSSLSRSIHNGHLEQEDSIYNRRRFWGSRRGGGGGSVADDSGSSRSSVPFSSTSEAIAPSTARVNLRALTKTAVAAAAATATATVAATLTIRRQTRTKADMEEKTDNNNPKDNSKAKMNSSSNKNNISSNINDSRKTLSQLQNSDDAEKYRFSIYQDGDGSESDPDGIPYRFLKMQKFNRKAAIQAFHTTATWREENNIDTILCRPHPQFDACKEITPHIFVGPDKTNHIVFVQRPALVNLQKAADNRVSNDDLIMHYVYVLEYCWNILAMEQDDRPNKYRYEKTMTSILDMTGLHFGVLRKRHLISFASHFVSMMSTHYPQRSYKTLVLNVPQWFNIFYKIFSPLLRESTKAKIAIYSHGPKQDQALLDLLGKDVCKCLPVDFFSTSTTSSSNRSSHNSSSGSNDNTILEMENELREFCLARLEEAGVPMQKVV